MKMNPALYNQSIDLLWHLLSEEGVKERYMKMAGQLGYSESCANDIFDDTEKALKFYYNETFLRLPASCPLVVGNVSK